jgi:hypothetical protein
MPAFVPKLVCPPYHFDIRRNRRGYWVARGRDGLAGGTFLTRKNAVRFALFETGGNSAHVNTYPEPEAARVYKPRAHERYHDRLVSECPTAASEGRQPLFTRPWPQRDAEIGRRGRLA